MSAKTGVDCISILSKEIPRTSSPLARRKGVQQPNSMIRESYPTTDKSNAYFREKGSKIKSGADNKGGEASRRKLCWYIIQRLCTTDDLEQLDFTSKADAIDDSRSTMNGCVTPVHENSTEKLVLDNSSQTVYSKFELSEKVETMILKNEEFFKMPI